MTPSNGWPDSDAYWRGKRVIVTGGSGFLGRVIVRKLRARGAAEVIVPRKAEYDLRFPAAVNQLLDVDTRSGPDRQPVDVLIHLAAHVGGLSLLQRNLDHPLHLVNRQSHISGRRLDDQHGAAYPQRPMRLGNGGNFLGRIGAHAGFQAAGKRVKSREIIRLVAHHRHSHRFQVFQCGR